MLAIPFLDLHQQLSHDIHDSPLGMIPSGYLDESQGLTYEPIFLVADQKV